MTIEYLGEKVFLAEVAASGEVWVAENSYHQVYTEEFDRSGFSLPVWSKREKAVDFLSHALLVGPRYEPYPIDLEIFTKAWLSDPAKGISELLINPDGKSRRILALTNEEFQASQAF